MAFSDGFKEKSKKIGKNTMDGARKLQQKINEKDRTLKTTTGKGLVHTSGDLVGDVAGTIIGKPIEYVGQKTNKKFVMDVGEVFYKSSRKTGDLVGQVGQGLFITTQGIFRWDGSEVWDGIKEVGKATGRTIVVVAKTAAYTADNARHVVAGIYSKDYERVKFGVSGIAKVVIVGGVAFLVIDLVDGGDIAYAEDGAFLNTHNSDLAGQVHPETGVPFDTQTIELENGIEVVGVFPDFDAVATVELPSELYETSDYTHFSYTNAEFSETVSQNPEVAAQFSLEQLEQIYAGETPDGYTWHHHEQLGKLELVDEEIHAKTGHNGGRSIWGGGSDAR